MANISALTNTILCNNTLFNNFLLYSMPASVSIDILRQKSTEWKLALEVVYMTMASIQFAMSILFNLSMLETVLQKTVRITSCGIYLLLFTLTSLIAMGTFYLRIIVTLYFNDEIEKHSLIYCRLASMIMNWTQIMCLWTGAFISVERVMIECFRFSIWRARNCSIISSILLLILALASCITWFFGTQYVVHPIVPTMHLCKMRQLPSIWKRVDEILTSIYIHVVLPWLLHVLSIVCILTHIIKRKIILIDAERSEWFPITYQQLKKHRDFFIPPIIIIICTMPHFIFDRLSSSITEPCLEYTTDTYLRLHTAFDLLYFCPQTFGFLFYIYPSNVYMIRYRETWTVNNIKAALSAIRRHMNMRRCETPRSMNISVGNGNDSSCTTIEERP